MSFAHQSQQIFDKVYLCISDCSEAIYRMKDYWAKANKESQTSPSVPYQQHKRVRKYLEMGRGLYRQLPADVAMSCASLHLSLMLSAHVQSMKHFVWYASLVWQAAS